MAKQKKQEKISVPSTSLLLQVNRVVGLDLSLTGTGWCDHLASGYSTGLIDTDKMEGLARIDYILKQIQNRIGTDFTKVLVVVEDFSFASKGSSLFQIAGLGYIIRHWLWSQGIQFKLVPPTVLKKFVTGTGNSDKSVMLKELYKRWLVDFNDDNIGDAYGLSRIGMALVGWDTELTKFQEAALEQLEKV